MTAKFLKWPVALLVFTLGLSAGVGVARGQYDQPTQTQNPPADKGKQAGPPINKEEEAAYKAFLAARGGNPATQVQLGEAFVVKFPQSHYLSGIYATMTKAYFGMGQEDKMFDTGTKAIELNPDNVDVLSLMSMAIPRRVRSTTPDAAQQMQKAETYAHHAIELIPNLPKPPEVDDAAFEKGKNDELSMAHSGLGLIDINHQKYDDARIELTQAVQLASAPDPVDYYLLGNADDQASFLNGAVAAYDKCAASGPLVAQCKSREDAVKKEIASGTKLSRD